MRKILLTVLFAMIGALCLFVTGCAPQDMAGLIVFADASVVYDGEAHTIEIEETGCPEGAEVSYTNAGPYTDVGEYIITVTITHPDYETYTDTATLTITAADMTSVVFDDVSVTYDGESHTIEATGYPVDAAVSYTDNGPYAQVGEYTVGVTITHPNYNTYTDTATLTITAADMASVVFDDKTVIFNGSAYTIEATGYPADAVVEYTNAGPFTEKNTYEIGVTITHPNYNTYTDTATLIIKSALDSLMWSYRSSTYAMAVEFNATFTSCNVYAMDLSTGESEAVRGYSASARINSDGVLIIGTDKGTYYSSSYNQMEFIETTNGGLRVRRIVPQSVHATDLLTYQAFKNNPTLKIYDGKASLNMDAIVNGETYAPDGWTEYIMDSDTGEYVETSGGVTGIVNGDVKSLSFAVGEDETSVRKYVYTFDKAKKGGFCWYQFKYDFLGFTNMRIKATTSTGGTYYIAGSKTSFYETYASSPTDISDKTSYEMPEIKTIEIELYYNPNGSKLGNFTIEKLEFSATPEI